MNIILFAGLIVTLFVVTIIVDAIINNKQHREERHVRQTAKNAQNLTDALITWQHSQNR